MKGAVGWTFNESYFLTEWDQRYQFNKKARGVALLKFAVTLARNSDRTCLLTMIRV